MTNPYTWFWRDFLKLPKPFTRYVQEWADTQSSLFGILVGVWGGFLTFLVLQYPGVLSWVLVGGSGLLYSHFFWGDYRFTRRGG